MFNTNYQSRVQEILDFITEITLGNYSYTLPLRNHKSELEQIVISLNTMVEEIDTTVHKINHDKSKEVIENLVFSLDRNFNIVAYSDNVVPILNYTREDLIGKPVKMVLSHDTKLPKDLYELLQHAVNKNHAFKVEFKHHNGYSWSGYGYLHGMISGGRKTYSLSVFKSVYQNEKMQIHLNNRKSGIQNYPSEYRSLLLQDQRQLVRRLHKYVMKRLDRKLKKLPVIAKEVGGSVTKIKVIFKDAYGDTVYAFHLRKRLEKAYTLLKDTKTPINEIAEECGFKSFSHFSRSFKKEFGITPSQARKS